MTRLLLGSLTLVAASAAAFAQAKNDRPNEPKTVPIWAVMGSRITHPFPSLPSEFAAKHSKEAIIASYRLCIDIGGHVFRTSVTTSIGNKEVDENIMKQIRENWVYKKQSEPLCFGENLKFQIP